MPKSEIKKNNAEARSAQEGGSVRFADAHETQGQSGSVRFALARVIGGVATFGLQKVLRKNGKNTPGKLALYADPQLIEHLRYKVSRSIMVVGTNGKTTVNNLIADVLCEQGCSVICNRDGANLDSGISTALLQSRATHAKPADWGVFESDELWLIKSLPYLQSEYVLLLNLFRDQLDRCGEIEHIQNVIADALKKSPNTTLVYNGDDPLCALIASKISNQSVAFGVSESMHLPQNTIADAQMCQSCEGIMQYEWRQYGQLGKYACPTCGFARPELDFSVTGVHLRGAEVRDGAEDVGAARENEGSSFTIEHDTTSWRLHTQVSAAYMIYNLAGVGAIAQLAGCSETSVQNAISKFAPNNGRLQKMVVRGHNTLLNLAKNPTGFNQNLKIVVSGAREALTRGAVEHANNCTCAVAFFINDKEADGHDVSWLWDVDFEELAAVKNIMVFAGGTRAGDMQVRLKYANIRASIVSGAEDLYNKLQQRGVSKNTNVYFIANYTSLPQVKASLEAMSTQMQTQAQTQAKAQTAGTNTRSYATVGKNLNPALNLREYDTNSNTPSVVIAHMFPDLLNLYGDAGNVSVLKRRLEWRGIPVEVRVVPHGAGVNLSDVDIVFLGGGPDREQRMASAALMNMRDSLHEFAEAGGVMLAICGGYQILGKQWLCGEDVLPGLGLFDIETKRAPGGSTNRLIGNVALTCSETTHPIIGFENHAGRTYLGATAQPFGRVLGHAGFGNNDSDTHRADGACYKNVFGTYLHGPLLSKNPEIADHLLQLACERCAARHGMQILNCEGIDSKGKLFPLDDSEEFSANSTMAQRMHV